MSTLAMCSIWRKRHDKETLERLGKNTGDRRLSKWAECLSGTVSPCAAPKRIYLFMLRPFYLFYQNDRKKMGEFFVMSVFYRIFAAILNQLNT